MTLRPTPLLKPQQGFTCLSDLHIGSSQVHEPLLKEELDLALHQGDRILIAGDLYDQILPQDSKRFQPHVLHPRLQGVSDVINKMVDMAYELLLPYAAQIDMIGVGNHDDLTRFTSCDPLLLVVQRLNQTLIQEKHSHRILYGGYCGFLTYTYQKKNFNIYYHHGFGGGASASGATADMNKLLAQVEDVDVIWMGHKHWKLATHIQRIRPARTGPHPEIRQIRFIRTGAYLQPLAGQTQQQIHEEGRKSCYSTDKGYITAGLGGARLLVDLSRKPLTIKVIQ